MKINLRAEEAKDIREIYEINKHAFETEAEAQLVELLRKGEAFIPELSIVAEIDGKIVGHILFTVLTVNDNLGKAHKGLALAPMAVLPEYQKMGIGKQLVSTGLEIAKRLDWAFVIVLGHADYYPKFGFTPASKYSIKAPFEVPDNAFMALELKENALEGISGVVEYAKEFQSL